MSATLLRLDPAAERRAYLESVVDNGRRSFGDMGRALRELRDEALYDMSMGTFEQYCKKRFDMSKRHVDRLIASSAVVDNLRPIGPNLCTSESVLRPLCDLSPDDQRAVAQEALLRWERPTAANVAALVRELKGTPEPAKRDDGAPAERIVALLLHDMDRTIQSMNSCMSLAELEKFSELLLARIEWRRRMDAKQAARAA